MNVELLIKVLRDTASKCLETKEVTSVDERELMYYNSSAGKPKPMTVEAYSKDWIAGRLLGMADTLDAMQETHSVSYDANSEAIGYVGKKESGS